MPSEKSIIDQMLDRQKRMFRIAQDPTRHGLTLKMIAADANLGYDSVRKYAAGETQMPMTALDALFGVLPDELLSLLLPHGRVIVAIPDGVDHDAIEQRFREFLAAKGEAHHPASEAGREIGPSEHVKLTKLAVVAGTAVAA